MLKCSGYVMNVNSQSQKFDHFFCFETQLLMFCVSFLSVPPTFQVQPSDTNVTRGFPLTLHCQATGSPLPMLAWQKDGQPVDTNHVTLLSNGSLHISTTVVQDAGKFSCIANNTAGSTKVSADVIIYGMCGLLGLVTVCTCTNTTKSVEV